MLKNQRNLLYIHHESKNCNYNEVENKRYIVCKTLIYFKSNLCNLRLFYSYNL